jgi:hypothetical protein
MIVMALGAIEQPFREHGVWDIPVSVERKTKHRKTYCRGNT